MSDSEAPVYGRTDRSHVAAEVPGYGVPAMPEQRQAAAARRVSSAQPQRSPPESPVRSSVQAPKDAQGPNWSSYTGRNESPAPSPKAGRDRAASRVDDQRLLLAAQEFLLLKADVQEWIEQRTGYSVGDNMQESLRNGFVLCALLIHLYPNLELHVNTRKSVSDAMGSASKFQSLDNIAIYIDACKNVGVRSEFLFDPEDLYDGKNLVRVFNNIRALARLSGDHELGAASVTPQYEFTWDEVTGAVRDLKRMDEDATKELIRDAHERGRTLQPIHSSPAHATPRSDRGVPKTEAEARAMSDANVQWDTPLRGTLAGAPSPAAASDADGQTETPSSRRRASSTADSYRLPSAEEISSTVHDDLARILGRENVREVTIELLHSRIMLTHERARSQAMSEIQRLRGHVRSLEAQVRLLENERDDARKERDEARADCERFRAEKEELRAQIDRSAVERAAARSSPWAEGGEEKGTAPGSPGSTDSVSAAADARHLRGESRTRTMGAKAEPWSLDLVKVEESIAKLSEDHKTLLKRIRAEMSDDDPLRWRALLAWRSFAVQQRALDLQAKHVVADAAKHMIVSSISNAKVFDAESKRVVPALLSSASVDAVLSTEEVTNAIVRNDMGLHMDASPHGYLVRYDGTKAPFMVEIFDTRLRNRDRSGKVVSTYTEYQLRITFDGLAWTLGRRYSHFGTLHKNLLALFPTFQEEQHSSAFFDSQRFKLFNRTSPDLIEKRRVWLQTYLRRIVGNHRILHSPPVIAFLELHTLEDASDSHLRVREECAQQFDGDAAGAIEESFISGVGSSVSWRQSEYFASQTGF